MLTGSAGASHTFSFHIGVCMIILTTSCKGHADRFFPKRKENGITARRLWDNQHTRGGSRIFCIFLRFQANPGGTILAQNYIELLCESVGLTACWIILRSEIKVNSVHRIFRANFLVIVHKFVEQKMLVVESRGGSRAPRIRARACRVLPVRA
jgi:hypothetical protein